MIKQAFGERLKGLREINYISQAKLSEITNVSREQISKIENGQVNVTLKTIDRFCKAFNLPIKELMNFDIDNKYKPKPFVKWAGGKTQLLNEINKFRPINFNSYFEPFVGGGAVFFELLPTKAVINDINQELICVYNCLKDKNLFDNFINILKEHEKNHSEDYFYIIREMDRKDNYHELPIYIRAARMVYLNKACFNGLYRVNSKGYFNVPSAKKKKVKAFDYDNMINLHNYFINNNIKILSTDFELAVKRARRGDFVYFDPPYDALDGKDSFTSYSENNFGKDEQIRLAELYKKLANRGVYVMLSNHNTSFIRELYKDFNIHVVLARRNINSDANGRGSVEEVLITNYYM